MMTVRVDALCEFTPILHYSRPAVFLLATHTAYPIRGIGLLTLRGIAESVGVYQLPVATLAARLNNPPRHWLLFWQRVGYTWSSLLSWWRW